MKHKIQPYEEQINHAIDRSDPASAATAIEIRFPDTFSERAWRVIRYLEGTICLFVYKGEFVVTDESLELTEYGDGSFFSPYGAPRWRGKSLEELEAWLEETAREFDSSKEEIPGWERPNSDCDRPVANTWSEVSRNVMVKLKQSNQFIGVKTYCRKHGSRGRFLIFSETLWQLIGSSVGETRLEEDCGNFVRIARRENDLYFAFTWLSIYGDGSVEGFKQDITVPIRTVKSALESGEMVKYLYIPPKAVATVDASRASSTIARIVENKRVRRAFSKAMRDCFQWRGDKITLYRDGKYGFYFATESGFPKSGGLILHEGTKNGRAYVYYSVHT